MCMENNNETQTFTVELSEEELSMLLHGLHDTEMRMLKDHGIRFMQDDPATLLRAKINALR